MLMRNRSPVSHVLHRTLPHQKEFLVLEMNTLRSHDYLLWAKCFRQSPWFSFIFVVGQGGFLSSRLMCCKGMRGYLQAQSTLLPLLSGLLLLQIPLTLRFTLELGNQWKRHPLESYNILVALVGVFSSQGGLGERTELACGE